MPLIKNGKLVDDIWAFVPDGHELSPGGCFTVSIGRFLSEHDQLLARNRSIGVRLQNTDDPSLLAPHLEHLHLIELDFPKYTDGRAFSQALMLRRRFGYKGEIRAIGQVLQDQLRLMLRSGFDAMMVVETDDAEGAFQHSSHPFSEFYQTSADSAETVFMKRHKKRQEKAAE
jgi:uncharacterized protein (DUF934 family)